MKYFIASIIIVALSFHFLFRYSKFPLQELFEKNANFLGDIPYDKITRKTENIVSEVNLFEKELPISDKLKLLPYLPIKKEEDIRDLLKYVMIHEGEKELNLWGLFSGYYMSVLGELQIAFNYASEVFSGEWERELIDFPAYLFYRCATLKRHIEQ